MNHFQRILSLILCLALLFPSLALPAAAWEDYGPIPEENNGVPLFFQTDYPDVPYSSGTLATSGCGITCLAMVATYLTGYHYSPLDLAAEFRGYGKNNIERLEYASQQLQLPWRLAANFDETRAALEEGDIAIIMMGAPSLFTTTQHFIVAAGLDGDGDILINDPIEYHYNDKMIKRALRQGFRNGDLLYGFSNAWIYDVSEMAEYPYLYVDNRYADLDLTTWDRQILARLIYAVASGESMECQQAIAEVMLNRLVYSEDFSPDMEANIINDPGLPSKETIMSFYPTLEQYQAIQNALTQPRLLSRDTTYFSSEALTDHVRATIGSYVFSSLH